MRNLRRILAAETGGPVEGWWFEPGFQDSVDADTWYLSERVEGWLVTVERVGGHRGRRWHWEVVDFRNETVAEGHCHHALTAIELAEKAYAAQVTGDERIARVMDFLMDEGRNGRHYNNLPSELDLVVLMDRDEVSIDSAVSWWIVTFGREALRVMS